MASEWGLARGVRARVIVEPLAYLDGVFAVAL